jgi:hypothetical protein
MNRNGIDRLLYAAVAFAALAGIYIVWVVATGPTGP